MVENEIETASLLNKIGKIDKLEERQARHAQEIKEIKDAIHSNELDGRITKVEKRQEFVFDQLKDIHKDVQMIEEKCDKQRTTCMAAVAPISLVADLKNDLKRMEERLQATYSQSRIENKDDNNSSAKWTRWAFVLSMLACVVSSVSVLVCVNVLIHLPK
jgi:predicted  nucleic acid-binding Zn-ribbon protein